VCSMVTRIDIMTSWFESRSKPVLSRIAAAVYRNMKKKLVVLVATAATV